GQGAGHRHSGGAQRAGGVPAGDGDRLQAAGAGARVGGAAALARGPAQAGGRGLPARRPGRGAGRRGQGAGPRAVSGGGPRGSRWQRRGFKLGMGVLGGALGALLVLPVLALLVTAPPRDLVAGLRHPLAGAALVLSLGTTAVSLALVLLLGTP